MGRLADHGQIARIGGLVIHPAGREGGHLTPLGEDYVQVSVFQADPAWAVTLGCVRAEMLGERAVESEIFQCQFGFLHSDTIRVHM